MDCGQARDRLMKRTEPDGALEDHLGACPACSRHASRLGRIRRALREHHAGVEPDAAFASRVVSRLPGPAADALGRAALRLLPATLALLLLLAWATFRTLPAPDSSAESSSEDVLSWVADLSGSDP